MSKPRRKSGRKHGNKHGRKHGRKREVQRGVQAREQGFRGYGPTYPGAKHRGNHRANHRGNRRRVPWTSLAEAGGMPPESGRESRQNPSPKLHPKLQPPKGSETLDQRPKTPPTVPQSARHRGATNPAPRMPRPGAVGPERILWVRRSPPWPGDDPELLRWREVADRKILLYGPHASTLHRPYQRTINFCRVRLKFPKLCQSRASLPVRTNDTRERTFPGVA